MSGFFTIPLSGLKEGHYTFEFDIDKEFFDLFDESEIREGDLAAIAEVDKMPAHFEFAVRIRGSVTVCCDRCLEMFEYPVECENRFLVKYGLAHDDSDPDIITLSQDEFELDLKQFFYEFIHLSLPIKRVHPVDQNGISTCNPEMIRKLREHLIDNEKTTDPRWDELKRLMNDN